MISFAPHHPLTGLVTAFRHLGQAIRAIPILRAVPILRAIPLLRAVPVLRSDPVLRRAPAQSRASRGHVVLLGAGPGAADLITLRGLQALQAADVIFYDRLSDPALLTHARPGARLVSVGKPPGAHSMAQDQIDALLVKRRNRACAPCA